MNDFLPRILIVVPLLRWKRRNLSCVEDMLSPPYMRMAGLKRWCLDAALADGERIR
jgi:hypothetical protein